MNATLTPRPGPVASGSGETILTELARAASRVSARHQSHGALVDFVLDLWQAQQVRQETVTPKSRPCF